MSSRFSILIYGLKGWIGSQFKQLLAEKNISFIEGSSRVDNVNTLKDELEKVNPTHVISFIGRTHGKIGNKEFTTIDYLEQPGKLTENIRDNLFSPLVLAFLCKDLGIHFTYLGTGCIFKFDDEHPLGGGGEQNGFTEQSLPNFFGSAYSIVKGFTDRLMGFFNDSVLNLRIRMPIAGEQNPRNFITKITTYKKICSIQNSMTVLPELLPKVIDMMQKGLTGTMNLTNPGLISHNEILQMFKEIVDPNFNWENFTLEEQRKILASDRSNNFLNTDKLQELYPDVKNIKHSVREILYLYKSSYLSPIKTLFVTGGAGFIGSNFINYFAKKNPLVPIINFDALYYSSNINNIDKEIKNSKNYTFIKGNLRSFDLLKDIFQTYKISHIIHFAAQTHVDNSFEDSIEYTKDNILGTHNLLEVNRLYNKNLVKFIHISTDEVYGESLLDDKELHKTEQSILCPTNPYAATKASAELLVKAYYYSFNLPIIITRGNNVYGPNQYPEKVIPRFISLLKKGEKVTIQGDGSCVRAFLHVYDTVTAFENVLVKGKIGEIYNIGCDEGMEYSIMELAKILIKMIRNTENYDDWIEYIKDRPFNDKRYYISNQKVKKLGWDIKINFLEGLQQLIEYTTFDDSEVSK